jgi:hypothetical protein
MIAGGLFPGSSEHFPGCGFFVTRNGHAFCRDSTAPPQKKESSSIQINAWEPGNSFPPWEKHFSLGMNLRLRLFFGHDPIVPFKSIACDEKCD